MAVIRLVLTTDDQIWLLLKVVEGLDGTRRGMARDLKGRVQDGRSASQPRIGEDRKGTGKLALTTCTLLGRECGSES